MITLKFPNLLIIQNFVSFNKRDNFFSNTTLFQEKQHPKKFGKFIEINKSKPFPRPRLDWNITKQIHMKKTEGKNDGEI